MKSLTMMVALAALWGAAAGAAGEQVQGCTDAAGTQVYSDAPCASELLPAVATLTVIGRQSAELERVDREIAAVRSSIATREMEQAETLKKIYRRQGLTREEIEVQADVVKQIHARKLKQLGLDLAALGERRNALVEESSAILLEHRGH